jgi:hypothetical protein
LVPSFLLNPNDAINPHPSGFVHFLCDFGICLIILCNIIFKLFDLIII